MRKWFLKRKIKALYLRRMAMQDSYSCGNSLLSHFSQEFSTLTDNINYLLDKLAVIDPDAPKTRL